MLGVAAVDSSCEFLFGKGIVFKLKRKGNADGGAMFRDSLNVEKSSHKERARFVRTFSVFKAVHMAGADKVGHFGYNEIERFGFRVAAFVFNVGTFRSGSNKGEQRLAENFKFAFSSAVSRILRQCSAM